MISISIPKKTRDRKHASHSDSLLSSVLQCNDQTLLKSGGVSVLVINRIQLEKSGPGIHTIII